MQNSLLRLLALLLALLFAPALAQQQPQQPQPAGPLTLAEVLASSRFHAPQVLEAMARIRGAEGRLLSTQAAFDTVFSADINSRVFGFYDGSNANVRLTQPLPENGGYTYGGYRISSGRFPVYEDEYYTNQAGEVMAGAVFSLLRDRAIDERRFARSLAEADIAIAEADRLMIAIGVQRQALSAYNAWVAAGMRLKVYRDLLDLAETRQAGFRRQVEEGARPRILLTENEQNILRRQTLVVQTEQQLAQAAAALSLYYRAADGTPITPPPSRLPPGLPPLIIPDRIGLDPATIAAARPDLRTLDIRIRQQSQRLALDRNSFLPKLDLKVEASRDLGPIGPGGNSRTPTEGKLGLSLTVPLQQSAARGRLAQTNAEIEAFRQRRRLLEDQIGAEVGQLAIAVSATARLRTIAEDEQDRATTMASAERRRFEAGASDFFLVNVREESAADAQVRALDAAVRQITANAELAAVTADLDALGL
ncbi:TolC family protein [Polymorphobacter sp.]|uniref:TolC family protein n=1 Tax=Polymorphobacter sp. TaxID=1909290 RepID=UPI003F6FE6BE